LARNSAPRPPMAKAVLARKPAASRRTPLPASSRRRSVLARVASSAGQKAAKEVAKKPVAKKPVAAAPSLRKPAAGKAKSAAKAAIRKRPAAASASEKPTGAAAAPWKRLASVAEKVRGTYHETCAFPWWSVQMLRKGQLERYAKTVVIYYSDKDAMPEVELVAKQREPANIGTVRCYDEDKFQKLFGHRHGAYGSSTVSHLMPNIAIYCQTPMKSASGEQIDVNVINVVACAFDSDLQPDWKYFMPLRNNPAKWNELVQFMQQMWRYIFECARRHQFKRVYLADVGGGAFAVGLEMHEETSYRRLKEESLVPVQQEYAGIVECGQLQRIPDWCFTDEARGLLSDSLLVNAWDPWSMVGNANRSDNSLDGFFGRCTAMALLCWPSTNPYVSWESVEAK